jgi:uridine kinase
MPIIIAIGGVSRSGKSSLALWLHKQLPNSMVLSQDDFPQQEELIPRVKDRTDWEHPDSINWNAWQKAIEVNLPENDYLILEGLFIYHELSLPTQARFNYYLSIDQDKFIEARKQETRWGKEPLWFIEHVWHSHFQHGLPPEEISPIRFHNIQERHYTELLGQVTS